MAEKKGTNPINVNSRDSEDDNKAQEKEEVLDLPLEKLNLGPRKKLLVMNLNGLLLHRTNRGSKEQVIKSRRADWKSGNYYVFKRPFSEDFMKFCMERFEVGIWTSTKEQNIDGALNCAIGTLKNQLLFVWGQSECTNSGLRCLENKYNPLYLKEMIKVWDNVKIGGPYSASNTLLIDDKPYKALLNPDNTSIFPHPYKPADEADNALDPKGELGRYLEGVREASDVESYVKDHPFGQPAITPSHPQWTFYSQLTQCLHKGN